MICNKTSRPVHWLQYYEELDRLQNVFWWVRSHGKVDNLRDKSMYLSEDVFLDNMTTSWWNYNSDNADPNPPQPICIFTNPGYGTTELLERSGRWLTHLHPSRTVIQVEAKDFLRMIRAYESKSKDLELTQLLKMVLTNELGIQNDVPVELFLLNLGTVTGDDSIDADFAYETLEEITSAFTSVRLWLTSTIPNHLKGRRVSTSELENGFFGKGGYVTVLTRLGILCSGVGLNDDIEGSVVRFWLRRMEPPLNKARLEQFIEEKAEKLLRSIPQDIAFELGEEIDDSLLALLLAEVYEEEAVEHARVDKITNDSIKIGTLTFSGLFQKWVSKRIEEYNNKDGGDGNKLKESGWIRVHTRLALDFLFPEKFPKLEHLLQPVHLEEIYKSGIVVEGAGKPRFLDPVFAKYFVAWFLKEEMTSEWSSELEYDLVEFILKEALATHPVNSSSLYCNSRRMNDSFQFNHFIIPYFLNDFLEGVPVPSNSNHSIPSVISRSSFDYSGAMRGLAHACANSRFSTLFNHFIREGAFDRNSSQIFDSEFVHMTISNSSLDFVKTAVKQFELHHNFTTEMRTCALHLAVQNSAHPGPLQEGKISILEWLIDEKGFGEGIANNLTHATKTLLHETVKGTKKLHERERNGKLEMVRKLVGINRELLVERDEDGRTPFLVPGTHVRILEELIHLGADVLARDNQNNTVLHHASRGLSYEWLFNEDYLLLLNALPNDEAEQLLQATNSDGLTPLMILVASYEPINNWYGESSTGQELLERMKSLGADFNFENPEKGSILAMAISHGRLPPTLRGLVQLGADLGWRGSKGQNLLHIAGKVCRDGVAEFLLGEGGLGGHVNDQDENGLTPLDYVIDYANQYEKGLETGLLFQKHGGRFTEVANPEGQSRLHVAVKREAFNSALLLLRLGVDVNAVDKDGNSPLHLLPKYNHSSNANLAIAALLLENGADPNALNIDGESPFQVALKNDKLDFETFQLLKFKTNMKWTPFYATQALVVLVRSGNVGVLSSLAKELEDHGAVINYKSNSSGDTLLHIATRSGNVRAVHYLVKEKGANVNSTNSVGDTPLILAAGIRDKGAALKMIMFLIDNGAGIYSRKSGDQNGKTFLHIFFAEPSRPSVSQIHSITNYLIRKSQTVLFDIVGGNEKLTPYQIIMQNRDIDGETVVLLHSMSAAKMGEGSGGVGGEAVN